MSYKAMFLFAPNSSGNFPPPKIMKLNILALVFGILTFGPLRVEATDQIPLSELKEILSPYVYHMFAESERQSAGKSEPISNSATEALVSARTWCDRVFSPEYRPADKAFELFDNAFGEGKIVRAKIDGKLFDIVVIQTDSVMAVLVKSRDFWSLDKEKTSAVGAKIFTKALVAHGSSGEKVVLPFFDEYLLEIMRKADALPNKLSSSKLTRFHVERKGYLAFLRSMGGEAARAAVEELRAARFGEDDSLAWYRNLAFFFGDGWAGFYFLKSETGSSRMLFLP